MAVGDEQCGLEAGGGSGSGLQAGDVVLRYQVEAEDLGLDVLGVLSLTCVQRRWIKGKAQSKSEWDAVQVFRRLESRTAQRPDIAGFVCVLKERDSAEKVMRTTTYPEILLNLLYPNVQHWIRRLDARGVVVHNLDILALRQIIQLREHLGDGVQIA